MWNANNNGEIAPTDWFVREIIAVEPGTGLTFRPGDLLGLAKRLRTMNEIWL
jgi:phosphate starvation-inducible protein PhoH